MESLEFMVVQLVFKCLVFLTDGFTVHPEQVMKQLRHKFMKRTSKTKNYPQYVPIKLWKNERES